MVPKAKLSDNQVEIASEIVRTDDESHWITGYAGSGKTVVITHAINEIASRNPGDTIGFLTYTHALKDMVSSGLSAKVKKSVEVLTLDAFFHRPKYFDHLFVDEIQDAEPRHLPKILGASPHLVVAGDPDGRTRRQGRAGSGLPRHRAAVRLHCAARAGHLAGAVGKYVRVH